MSTRHATTRRDEAAAARIFRAMLEAAAAGKLEASPGMAAGMAGALEALAPKRGEAARLADDLDELETV